VPVSFLGSVQSDSSTIKWNWDFGNGGSGSNASPPGQNYSSAGNYLIKATVTDSSGCSNSDTSTLTVHPLPQLNAGADTAICYGTSLTLRPTGASSYLWASSSTLSCTSCANPIATPIDTSVYYVVTGTNAVGGCQKTDTVNVKVIHPFKIAGMITDTLCLGESVKLSITGADNYTWLPAAGLSNANISNPVAAPAATTLYTVIGRDYKNCFADTGYVPIAVYPIPVFNIAQDKITLSAGNSITINTTSSDDITNWEWFPSTGLSCSNCPEPVTNANNTVSYKATVTNAGGCRAEDKVTVQVFCDNGNVFMPNTFSPNRDGVNDVFYPRGKGIAGIRNMQIFNRSGRVVFQRSNIMINDANTGWDGTYNGQLLDSDVFVYQVDVICSTGQIFSVKGDISLVR
jgi:gliding motility-associated-like protein